MKLSKLIEHAAHMLEGCGDFDIINFGSWAMPMSDEQIKQDVDFNGVRIVFDGTSYSFRYPRQAGVPDGR